MVVCCFFNPTLVVLVFVSPLNMVRKNHTRNPTIHLQIMDPRHQKATYIEQTFWIRALSCIRCGIKCELLLPACRLDHRRCHLHLCHLHAHPVFRIPRGYGQLAGTPKSSINCQLMEDWFVSISRGFEEFEFLTCDVMLCCIVLIEALSLAHQTIRRIIWAEIIFWR